MSQPSIETKVGMLILVAVGLLAAFVVVMGGVNFQPSTAIYIDFDNPGGLQPGAPVKIAGVKVGTITEIQFRGGEPVAVGTRPSLVRVRAQVERRYQKSIHDDAVFYVTTQGVLGEQFLAIDPGSASHAAIADGAVTRGLDPPRLDMLLAEGYELLHTGIAALRENKEKISETFDGLHDTLRGTGDFFKKHKDRLDRIAENVEKLTVDTGELMSATRARYVDNPQIARIIDHVEHTSASISRDIDPVLRDARDTLANTSRLSATVGAPEEQAKIKTLIADVAELAGRAKAATADAQAIVAKIKKGEGSVGALVMDEQIYDDAQELLRDLKHNPWKFFWRE